MCSGLEFSPTTFFLMTEIQGLAKANEKLTLITN